MSVNDHTSGTVRDQQAGTPVRDVVLLSASAQNFADCLTFIHDHPGLGIEVTTFSLPDTLDSAWQPLADHYRDHLAIVRARGGRITMHGPFMDLPAASPDALIRAVCASRYRQAITIAGHIGAEIVVLHANFIGQILTEGYRQGWHQRSVDFWKRMADIAGQEGVTLALENMWEYAPALIGDVLAEIDHPHLRACLDVGHAHLYGPEQAFDQWVDALEPFLVHAHLNNNDGRLDVHRGLSAGVLDYAPLLERLRNLPQPPSFTLEMDAVADMAASLAYFNLG